MRELTFSLFRCNTDIKPIKITQSWDEWVALLSEHDIRPPRDCTTIEGVESTKNGNCFILGELKPGATRCAEGVKEANGIALDLEHLSEDEILKILKILAPYEYIAYSTHKHRSPPCDGPRLRVILPFLESVQSDEYAAVWLGFDILTEGVNDRNTKDISRLHYAPSSWSAEVVEFHHNKNEFTRWISGEELKKIYRDNPDKIVISSADVEKDVNRLCNSFKVVRKNSKMKDIVRAILNGEAYAEQPHRHETNLKITLWIASKFYDDPLSEEAIAQVFEKSVKSMKDIDSGAPDLMDVVVAYRGALVKVDKKNKEDLFRNQLKGDVLYSSAELEKIAFKQNCTVDQLSKRWIIQKGRNYYLLDENSNYHLFEHVEARAAASSVLKRAPIPLFEKTHNSGYRKKTIDEVVIDDGTVASRVIGNLTIQKSIYYPDKREMHEAVSPIRKDIDIKFHDRIDEFFKIMAGDKYDKFNDWLACFPDLDKLLCALYIVGPKNVFKTGLAAGLSKIWQEKGSPTPLKTVLNQFNENLVLINPLILSDESVPMPKEWGGEPITATLREMVSTMSRPLNRKFFSSSLLYGSIRLILCANNEFLLRSENVPTPEDLEATAERFLYIKIPQIAQEWKEKNITAKESHFWCEQGFAEHCLWLRENREVVPTNRFWVEGDIGEMHSLLLSGSEFNGMVNYWLIQYLMNPNPINRLNSGLIRIDIENGRLLVNDQAMIDFWETYNKKTRVEAKPNKVATALRSMSRPGWVQRRFNGRRIRYRDINVKNLFAWSEEHGFGSKQTMLDTLYGKNLGENVEKMPTGDDREERIQKIRDRKKEDN